MTVQEYMDSQLTDYTLRRILTDYLYMAPADHRNDLVAILTTLKSNALRAEFYVNVVAGNLLSVRQAFVGGHTHDGPIYGYALSLGCKPENLEGAIDYVRRIAQYHVDTQKVTA